MPIKQPDLITHNNPLYPIVQVDDIKGFSIVTSIANRNALSYFKRRLGHIINVTDTGIFKYLHATSIEDVDWTNNANWADFTSTESFVPTTRKVNNLALSSDITITTSDIANCAALDPITGKLLDSQVPDLAISQYLGNVANETAMLALVGKQGDWCIRDDESKVYIITAQPSSTLSNWKAIQYPGASAAWGMITGSIENQTDLISYIQVNATPKSPIFSVGYSQNYLQYTEEFSNAIWSKYNTTPSPADAIDNPVGVPNAEYLTATDNSASIYQTANATTNGDYTFSIWIKSNIGSNTNIQLQINSEQEAGTPKPITVTTTWTRYFVTQYLTTNHTTVIPYILLLSSGNSICVWGAQLEEGSVMSEYSQIQTDSVQTSKYYILRASRLSNFETGRISSYDTISAYNNINIYRDNLGTTPTQALILKNTIDATVGIPTQMTPSLSLQGTTYNAGVKPFKWDVDSLGTAFDIGYTYNNGTRSTLSRLRTNGLLQLNIGTKSISLGNEITFDNTDFFKISANTKANIDTNTLTGNTNFIYVNNNGNTVLGQSISSVSTDLLEIRSSLANYGLSVVNSTDKGKLSIIRNTSLALNDILGTLSFGNSTVNGAEINVLASEAWSGSSNGVNMFIATNANGANTRVNRIGIYNDGKVAIGNITPTSSLDVNGDIEILNSSAYYYGDPTTNGSYRTKISGSDLIVETRLAGTWTTKINLSNIYTSNQVDTLLNAKANKITSPNVGRIWQSDSNGQPTETSFTSSSVLQISSINLSDISVGDQKIVTVVKQGDGSGLVGNGVNMISDAIPSSTIISLEERSIWNNNTATISGNNTNGAIGYKGQKGNLSDGSVVFCTGAVINSVGSASFVRCNATNSLDLNNATDLAIANLLAPNRIGGNPDTDWDITNNVLIISTKTCIVGTWFSEGTGYLFYCYANIGSAYYWRRSGMATPIQKMITNTSHPILTTSLNVYDWTLGVYTQQVGDETSYHEQYYIDNNYIYTKFNLTQFYRLPLGILTKKITLTNSQIKALATTPVSLLAAGGAGYLHLIESACLQLKAGSEVLIVSSNSDLAIRYASSSNIITIETTGFLDQNSNQISYSSNSLSSGASSALINKAIEIFNVGTAISGNASNNATLDVIITYKTIKLY